MHTQISDTEKNVAVKKNGMVAITSDEAKTYSPQNVYIIPMQVIRTEDKNGPAK